jgi:diguanylate cyclase (GGDEF)-like protein
MKHVSARTLTTSYVTALLIIAGLSIACHFILAKGLGVSEGFAATINLSGRQRMLSQRMASLAAQYRLGDQSARLDLLSATDEFERNHAKLLFKVENDGDGSAEARQLRDLYSESRGTLDAQMSLFEAEARQVASMPRDDRRLPLVLARLFAEARAPLLANLDEIVSIRQREADNWVWRLQFLQWTILAVVLLTLIAEAFSIFQPMVLRIVQDQSRLIELASIDELTGVSNRRSFVERSNAELERAHRYGRPVSLMLLDIDHFKQVNDTHGHAAGDDVLKAVSQTLGKGLRSSDVLGRIGGEEFAALLPETEVVRAAEVAERLRKAVEGLAVTYRDLSIPAQVSIGVVEISAKGLRLEDGMSAADAALYAAKQAGRNCVIVREIVAGTAEAGSAELTVPELGFSLSD